jgi:hypothetical protein
VEKCLFCPADAAIVANIPLASYTITLIVISFNMKNLLFDVISRSCKYQLEGYWQQSLHQLGKMDIFPQSGLCMFIYSDPLYITTSFVSRPNLFLPCIFPCIRPLYNNPLSNDCVLWVKILHITTIRRLLSNRKSRLWKNVCFAQLMQRLYDYLFIKLKD